jgi:acetyl esterase/lipase
MTFITSFMRNVADHTSLADIVLIRRLISLHVIIPLPADAVVTPITFTVPLQTGEKIARGFLRELDVKETGSRELTGEWVVGTEVWKRLKAERRARQEEERKKRRKINPAGLPGSGANGLEQRPETPDADTDEESTVTRKGGFPGERVIYYVHGGAYYVGNAATHRLITIGVSKACNARVFCKSAPLDCGWLLTHLAITYRLAPEHAFPLPLHDVLHGYLRLLAPPLSIPPENIVIMGDSAGGGLGLALCMYLRDEGYKMPAALVLMSPWVDLTMSCGSWDENADLDVVPRPEADGESLSLVRNELTLADHLNPVGCYLGPKGIATYLTHPYASPLFGDFHDLPPMLIQSGDSEVLRDEIILLAHKASLAGVIVTHELYEDMVHVFQMFTWLSSAKTAINSVGRWVRVTLPAIEEATREKGVPGRLGAQVGDSTLGEMAGQARAVRADGEDVGVPFGQGQVLPEEEQAMHDQARTKTPSKSALRLHIDIDEQPTIDLDSLPVSDSGSPTPRSRSPDSGYTPANEDLFTSPVQAPGLRRTLTAFATSSPSSPTGPPAPSSVRRRRPTASSVSPHVSPAASVHDISNPVSPTPSIRRRLRSPTLTQPQPTTRARSKSHSDIHHLVEGYVEGGAANETVVYAPGGEIKSVGILGEEDEEEDLWALGSPTPHWNEVRA